VNQTNFERLLTDANNVTRRAGNVILASKTDLRGKLRLFRQSPVLISLRVTTIGGCWSDVRGTSGTSTMHPAWVHNGATGGQG